MVGMDHPVAVAVVAVLFTLTSMGCLLRAVTAFDRPRRISSVLHLIAGLVMLAMLWTWYFSIPSVVWIVFFTGAAAWYAYRLLFHGPGPEATTHHTSRRAVAYHAAMMLAMAWMVVAMTPNAPLVDVEAASGAHTDHEPPMGGMPGMDAGSTTHHSMDSMTGGQAWALPITWVLGIGLALAAGWFCLRSIHRIGTTTVWTARITGTIVDTLVDAAMAAGMAVMLLVMTT